MSGTRIERVEEMPVFRLFYDLALTVELETRGLGPDFRWLRRQVLRSSESVCANMTEGFYSQYSTEYVQALYRCRREGRETVLHLRYAAAAAGLSGPTVSGLVAQYEGALRQLASLIVSVERKMERRGKSKVLPPEAPVAAAGET